MDQVNKRLGKYVLKSHLGQGGMGSVYLATDVRLRRDVALKILPPAMMADEMAVRRFQREARLVAKLSHPNVVAIHDVDQQDGCCYLVMELLSGGTAQDLLARGTIPWTMATTIMAQACRGVAAAHEAGVIHRDLKPSNLMLTADGSCKVADFGLAKVVDPALASKTMKLTANDTIVGTPQYMSPEQCKSEPLDERSDIYSLGATYFALLAGRPPFADAPPLQVMFAHCAQSIPDVRALCSDLLPDRCVEIVARALAKNRAQRFATVKEMQQALEALLTGTPPTQTSVQPQPVPTLVRSRTAKPESTIDYQTMSLANGDERTRQERPRVQPADWRATRTRLGAAAVAAVLLLGGLGWALRSWLGGSATTHEDVVVTGPRSTSTQAAEKPIALKKGGSVAGIHARIHALAFAPDGRSLYGAMAGDVWHWDIDRERDTARQVRRLTGTSGGIETIAVGQRWLAAGGKGKTVWLWRQDADKPTARLTDFAGEISSLAISPDGRRLAVGTYSEAKLYELDETGARLLKELGNSSSRPLACYMVLSVAFSADSRWLATTSWTGRTIAIWDTGDGALRNQLPKQPTDPLAVAFVPDGARVLFGLRDTGLHSWDITKGQVQRLSGNERLYTRAIAVTPAGRTAIVGGEWGGVLGLYDLQRGAAIRKLNAETSMSATTAIIATDGRLVATAGGDDAEQGTRGCIHWWHVVPQNEE